MKRSRIAVLVPLVLSCLHCAPPDPPDGEPAAGEPPEDLGAATAALSLGEDDSLSLTKASAGFGDSPQAQFGHALATGDFDDDGFQDLAVGVPYADPNGITDAGSVVVFYGSAGGLNPSDTETLTQGVVAGMANESYDMFGYRLAAGDFNGDGKDDLAVGVPYEDVGTVSNGGAVAVLFGSTAGLLPASTQLVTQSTIGAGNQAGDTMGASLAAGDFNADGKDDLAIGIPYEDISGQADAGRVAVLFGSTSGLVQSSPTLFDQTNLPGLANEAGDRFGHSLAAGDLDGDKDDDLVIGVPYEDVGSPVVTDGGVLVTVEGSTSGFATSQTAWYAQNAVGGTSESGDRFGWAVAIGDFNGDGFGDVAASAPYETVGSTGPTNGGHVGFLLGGPNALVGATGGGLTEEDALGTPEANDMIGYTLTTGDFNGDGFADLVAGVPHEDVGSAGDAGGLLAFFGHKNGLRPAHAYSFAQDHVGGAVEQGDWFGWALAAGDFNGDGADSLAAGAPLEDVGSIVNAGAVFVRTIEPGLPDIHAKAAFMIERVNSPNGPVAKVFGVKSPDVRRAPASTTKMMTALIAVELIEAGLASASDTVTVPWNVLVESQNGGTVAGLAPGDTVSLEDLLYMMMLPSGNDAAVAIAMHLASNREVFVSWMNSRAGALGLDNTHYVTVSGRDPINVGADCDPYEPDFDDPDCAHYSTARDLAALAHFALTKPLFREVVEATTRTTTTWSQDGTHVFENTNELLPGGTHAYSGAYGVKTGTTTLAGPCLVAAVDVTTASTQQRDILTVVLGAEDANGVGARYSDTRELLDVVQTDMR